MPVPQSRLFLDDAPKTVSPSNLAAELRCFHGTIVGIMEPQTMQKRLKSQLLQTNRAPLMCHGYRVVKPNSITLAGSKLARSWSQTGSKPNSIILSGSKLVRSLSATSFEPVCNQLRTR